MDTRHSHTHLLIKHARALCVFGACLMLGCVGVIVIVSCVCARFIVLEASARSFFDIFLSAAFEWSSKQFFYCYTKCFMLQCIVSICCERIVLYNGIICKQTFNSFRRKILQKFATKTRNFRENIDAALQLHNLRKFPDINFKESCIQHHCKYECSIRKT